jgi:hypothetical protein
MLEIFSLASQEFNLTLDGSIRALVGENVYMSNFRVARLKLLEQLSLTTSLTVLVSYLYSYDFTMYFLHFQSFVIEGG